MQLAVLHTMPADERVQAGEPGADADLDQERGLALGPLSPPYNITVRWYPDVDEPEVFHEGLSVGTAAYVLHTAADYIEFPDNADVIDEEEDEE